MRAPSSGPPLDRGVRGSRRRRDVLAGDAVSDGVACVVERHEEDITEVDAYLCGPPPMVDAAIALLEAKGVPEEHIYFDKFTTTEHQ